MSWKAVVLMRDSSSMLLEGSSPAALLSKVDALLGAPFDGVLRMAFVHVLENEPPTDPATRGRELSSSIACKPP